VQVKKGMKNNLMAMQAFPSTSLTSATLSPPCPTKPGLGQQFGPSFKLIQLQSHASGGILIYKPILSQDFALKKKLVGLILGNRM